MAGRTFNTSMLEDATRRALEDITRRLRDQEARIVVEIEAGTGVSKEYADAQDAAYSTLGRQYTDAEVAAQSLLDRAYTDARLHAPSAADLESLIAAANALYGVDIGSIDNPDVLATDLITTRHLLAGSVTGAQIRATGSITVGGAANRIEIIGTDFKESTSIRSVSGDSPALNEAQGSWDGTGDPTPVARTSWNAGVVVPDVTGHGMEALGFGFFDYSDSVDGWIQFPFTSGGFTAIPDDLDGLAPDAEWFTASTTGSDVAMVEGGGSFTYLGSDFITLGGELVAMGV